MLKSYLGQIDKRILILRGMLGELSCMWKFPACGDSLHVEIPCIWRFPVYGVYGVHLILFPMRLQILN